MSHFPYRIFSCGYRLFERLFLHRQRDPPARKSAKRGDNVGDHDDGYESQAKRIKPFHIKDQPPCYQLAAFLVFILTFGMLKVNNKVKRRYCHMSKRTTGRKY